VQCLFFVAPVKEDLSHIKKVSLDLGNSCCSEVVALLGICEQSSRKIILVCMVRSRFQFSLRELLHGLSPFLEGAGTQPFGHGC
jgi:hypothetical protein